MSSDYLSDSVDSYVSGVEDAIEVSENLSKGNTEKRVIEPFLHLLEWPLAVPETNYSVELDYRTGEDSVEYAFVSEGEPLVFVKTVGFEETLPSEVTVENILEEEFNWGVLTNGNQYEFYRYIDGNLETVRSFELDDMVEHEQFLTYMSSSSLETGRTEAESTEYDEAVADRRTVISETSGLSDRLAENISTVEDGDVRSEVNKLEDSLDRLLGFEGYFTVEDSGVEDDNGTVEEDGTDENSGSVEDNTEDGTEHETEDDDDDLRSFDSSVSTDSEGDQTGKAEASPSESSDGSSEDSSDNTNEEDTSSGGGLFSFLSLAILTDSVFR